MTVRPSRESEEPLRIGGFFVKPKSLGPPVVVTLSFYSSSSDWKFLNFHPIAVLADGEGLDLPTPRHRGNVFNGGVSEYISVDLPLATFIKIANAENVEMRLGLTEMRLTQNHMEALRDLLSRAIEVD
jgi:hypothetical protein